MDSISLSFVQNYWPIAVVVVILAAILVGFPLRFVLPAMQLRAELKRATTALRRIQEKAGGSVVDLEGIEREAMSSPSLSRLWSEFAQTLRPERREDESGRLQIIKWRAPGLAEMFFSEQALVDVRLKTEFYRHLPGILTGLGIIGTFSGLIFGLTHFDVSLEPAKAQEQLRNLVNLVGHAFIVSAIAIAMAMLFTWIEKSLVAANYRQVEELRQIIDSLFGASAGEEHLERIAVATETSATQALQIKDALVADLRQLLDSQSARAAEISTQSARQISADISQGISDRLGAPIADIASAVKAVSVSQGDAVNRMLTDVLASFSEQMERMFGGQIQGMSDLLQQTSQAMRDTAQHFERLAGSMGAAGKDAVDAMGERLNHTIAALEARQQLMNKQMGEFVEQVRASVSESQSESSRVTQQSLAQLGQLAGGLAADLRRQAEESSERDARRQRGFDEASEKAIESMSGQVEKLLAQSAETSRSLQDSVAKLAASSDSSISRMNSGAETLFVAASDFAKAGQGVSETMKASQAAAETLQSASRTLSAAADSAREVIEDQRRTREAFALMVSDLKSSIETAKREASMTAELVDKLQAASNQLADAQGQAGEYLKGVSDVLEKALGSFAENVQRALREANRQFQSELSDAVGLLSGAIKDARENNLIIYVC